MKPKINNPMKIKYILLWVIASVMFTSCSTTEPERKWQECDKEMIRAFVDFISPWFDHLPNPEEFACDQVYVLLPISNGALKCQFDTSELYTICKPDRGYVSTQYIRTKDNMLNNMVTRYYKIVDPCTWPSWEIQGCSSLKYFVELGTW